MYACICSKIFMIILLHMIQDINALKMPASSLNATYIYMCADEHMVGTGLINSVVRDVYNCTTLRQALYVAKANINLHRRVDGLEGFLANAKASRSQQTALDSFLS